MIPRKFIACDRIRVWLRERKPHRWRRGGWDPDWIRGRQNPIGGRDPGSPADGTMWGMRRTLLELYSRVPTFRKRYDLAENLALITSALPPTLYPELPSGVARGYAQGCKTIARRARFIAVLQPYSSSTFPSRHSFRRMLGLTLIRSLYSILEILRLNHS